MRKIKEQDARLVAETSLAVQTARKHRTENELLTKQNEEVRGKMLLLTGELKKAEETIEKLRTSLSETQKSLRDVKIEDKNNKKEIRELRTEIAGLKAREGKSVDHDLKFQMHTASKVHLEALKEVERKMQEEKAQLEESHTVERLTYQLQVEKLEADMSSFQALSTKQAREIEKLRHDNKHLTSVKSELSAEVAELLVDIAIMNEKMAIFQSSKSEECNR